MPNDLQKHTFHLRSGDMAHIQTLVPHGKASELIRKIVSRFVDSTKEAEKPAPAADLNKLKL